jgi:hypothetical protein
VSLKTKEIYGLITQGQENAKHFLAGVDWLAYLKW